MNEVIATCPEDVLSRLEAELRSPARTPRAALEAMPLSAGAEPDEAEFDPFRRASARISDPEDAIGLVRRGVRVAPVVETTPLLPLYKKKGRELPAEMAIAADEQGYEFYLVELTFSLRLDDDESPDCAELVVKVRDGVSGPRASRAIEIFPQRAHTTYFRAQGQLSVNLGASMKFSVDLDQIPGAANWLGSASPGASLEAGASGAGDASASIVAGPFKIDVGDIDLDVSGDGARDVEWRYRTRRALAGKNDFKSFLVLKVAKETDKVNLLANIGVRTFRRTWKTLWLREALPILYANASLAVELSRPAPAPAP